MAFFKHTPDEAPKSQDRQAELSNSAPSYSDKRDSVFIRPREESFTSDSTRAPMPKLSHETAMAKGVIQGGRNTAFQVYEQEKESLPDGQFLNAMDGEMTSGIERYFPSPLFRLRVSQKRLLTQMASLREELDQYRKIPGKSSEMMARQKSLQRRLTVLELREQRVSWELSSLMWGGRFLSPFFAQLLHVRRLIPEVLRVLHREWQRLTRGQAYITLTQDNEELAILYRIVSTRMADPTVSTAEWGRLINLYDRLIEKSTRDAQVLSKPKAMVQPEKKVGFERQF